MNNRWAILLAFVAGFLAAWLIFRSNATHRIDDASISQESGSLQRSAQERPVYPEPPILERPDSRVPAFTEQPKPATEPAPAQPVPAPAVPKPVGDPASWPAEYANKSLEELVADRKRLEEEFKQDIEAEVQRRFKDGRCESYPSGSEPKSGKTSGIYRGQLFGNTYKTVNLDPSVEPDLFIKQEKAGWLYWEIYRRQH
jgi:hypothetical protein